ncbi:MAG: type II secretion system inner membrane protein GspF [Proteobacteria bacterium]|nr:type II secretion system inner membrane protein GspF [Pseudomonadota bacterium]
MPVYAYRGVTNAGKSTRGSVMAESQRAARDKMRREGIFLTELVEGRGGAAAAAPAETSERSFSLNLEFLSFLNRVPAMETAIATRQLSTLVGAGIPLVEALGALTEQVEHRGLQTLIGHVRERVNEGASLADALQSTEAFDDLYVSMVRAGEAGGALETVLARLADYLEDQVRLKNKVTSILIYPAVMLFVAIGVVGLLVTVVLPQITDLLQGLGQELPIYTQVIIAGSEFVRGWWWALLAVTVAGALGLRAVLQTENGRAVYDRVRLKLPVIGRVARVLAIARFSRTLSTLLAGGISIVRALDIARHVANNAVLSRAIEAARTSIVEGAPLAQPLRASGEFPPLVTHMIEVGEQSGELESMLAKVAETYDEQVETAISRLTALLEPLLILLMVGIVLVIVLSTLMPLLQFTSALQ